MFNSCLQILGNVKLKPMKPATHSRTTSQQCQVPCSLQHLIAHCASHVLSVSIYQPPATLVSDLVSAVPYAQQVASPIWSLHPLSQSTAEASLTMINPVICIIFIVKIEILYVKLMKYESHYFNVHHHCNYSAVVRNPCFTTIKDYDWHEWWPWLPYYPWTMDKLTSTTMITSMIHHA